MGHLSYFDESIHTELNQYGVANDQKELPFIWIECSRIYYDASKNQNNNLRFGTIEPLNETGHLMHKHSTFPVVEDYDKTSVLISYGNDVFYALEKVMGYEKVPILFDSMGKLYQA